MPTEFTGTLPPQVVSLGLLQGGNGSNLDRTTTRTFTGSGVTGAEFCRDAVERVPLYRDGADETPVPDEVLAEQLAESEAQIDTQADDQDWGDRIIEDLTGVRRQWVTARSAASDGDDEKAQAHGRAAVDLLDHIVDRADCPTA